MFSFRQIALYLIYFFNVLLIFLLFVEDKVQVPVFLQVTGRMHPVVLHFPLVLLFAAIALECLLVRKTFQHPAVTAITSFTLYVFAVSAALTALFGFFLYKEGSYKGEEVMLHKWIGTAVSILAVLLVWLKDSPFARSYHATLGVSALCLIVGGHLGSEITHGKGFLTEPIRNHRQLQVMSIEHADSAMVFRDVIQPILNEKCVSCHNANRAKNDLILADYEGLTQGGENRDALVAGHADKSLIYKYALLPMNDSLHMPPKEKLQLDREEIKLIGWWINSGADADVQYIKMPKVDSIETIMLAKFQPKKGVDLLDISFADQDEIAALNTPYRTVQQIAATKPYIAVFLGSKKDFNASDLTELGEIGNQVVSIDLGNSAVKDNDIQNIKQFTHLQKLHLQNTSIGDEAVKHLKDLHYLDVLNLSGTKITVKTLDEVSGWKNLKKLYLYNTSVGEASVVSFKKSHPDLELYNTQLDLSDSVYNAQLTTPVVKIDSIFFRGRAHVDVKLSRGNVKYYYTLDGSEPVTSSSKYTEPFDISHSGVFKIKAAMEGWMDSKVATFSLLRIGPRPDRVILETKPDPKHAGKLDSTLVDGKSGGLNRDDKEYLGFINRDHEVLFQMNKPANISQITLSFLEDVAKGVFAPQYIEVWGGTDKNKLVKLGRIDSTFPTATRPASKGLITITFPEQSYQVIRLKAKTINTLPPWVPVDKSIKPSVYIDEVSLE